MFKNLLLTFFLFFSALLAIYPSKKENTYLIDYCHSFEKILSRNSLEKNKNVSQKHNSFIKEISLYGTKKTKGDLVNKIINQYKNSKKSYCFAGYWIEFVKPGTFESILYKQSRQKINQYKNTKKEIDEFIKDINSEYESIKKEFNKFFE